VSKLEQQVEFSSFAEMEWRLWIAENKLLGVDDSQIIEVLVQSGLEEELARRELRSVTSHPYVRAGDRVSQMLRKLRSILDARVAVSALSPQSGIVPRRCKVTRDEFLEQYYAKNQPVILLDLMRGWKALTTWTPEYLKAVSGGAIVEVMDGRNADERYEINLQRHRRNVVFSEYIDRVTCGGETNDYYLVANNHLLERKEMQPLLADIEVFPEYLDPAMRAGRTFFWFGPAGTVTPLHHDIANILMAQVIGRKLVTLISPDQTHLVYNHLGVHSEVNCEAPDYERHPLFRNVTKTEIILDPGEVLFLPVGWWHHVRALDVSITVSFVNFIFPNGYDWFSPALPR